MEDDPIQPATTALDWTKVPWAKARWLLRFPWDWPELAWQMALALVDHWEGGEPIARAPLLNEQEREAIFAPGAMLAASEPTAGQLPPGILGHVQDPQMMKAVARLLAANKAWVDGLGLASHGRATRGIAQRGLTQWVDELGNGVALNFELWRQVRDQRPEFTEQWLELAAQDGYDWVVELFEGNDEAARAKWQQTVDTERDGLRRAWKDLVEGYAEAAGTLPSADLAITVADLYLLDLGDEAGARSAYEELLPHGITSRRSSWARLLRLASLLLMRADPEVGPETDSRFTPSGVPEWEWDDEGLAIFGCAFVPEFYRSARDAPEDWRAIWLDAAVTIFESRLKEGLDPDLEAGSNLRALLSLRDPEVYSALSGLAESHIRGAASTLSREFFGDQVGAGIATAKPRQPTEHGDRTFEPSQPTANLGTPPAGRHLQAVGPINSADLHRREDIVDEMLFIDPDSDEVYVLGQPIDVGERQIEVLKLLRAAGRTVKYAELWHVWNGRIGEERPCIGNDREALQTGMSRLKKKLGPPGDLIARNKLGYKLTRLNQPTPGQPVGNLSEIRRPGVG